MVKAIIPSGLESRVAAIRLISGFGKRNTRRSFFSMLLEQNSGQNRRAGDEEAEKTPRSAERD